MEPHGLKREWGSPEDVFYGITHGIDKDSKEIFMLVSDEGGILSFCSDFNCSLSSGETSNQCCNHYGVIFGNSTFVIVGQSGTILTTTDVTTRTSKTSGTTDNLTGVTYGNGTFVVVGVSGTILTSSDATTWTSRTSGTSYQLKGVTFTE